MTKDDIKVSTRDFLSRNEDEHIATCFVTQRLVYSSFPSPEDVNRAHKIICDRMKEECLSKGGSGIVSLKFESMVLTDTDGSKCLYISGYGTLVREIE